MNTRAVRSAHEPAGPVVVWPRTGPTSAVCAQGEVVPVAEFAARVGVVGPCWEDPRQFAALAMKAEVDACRLEDVAGLCEEVASRGIGWHGDDVVVAVVDGATFDEVEECRSVSLAAVIAVGVDVMHDHAPLGQPLIRAVIRHSSAFEELVGLSAQWSDERATYEAFIAPVAHEHAVSPRGAWARGQGRQAPVLQHFFGEKAAQPLVLIYVRREADVVTDLHDAIVRAQRGWLMGLVGGALASHSIPSDSSRSECK